jgi:ABC-type uncharacterized transport system permease subunit
VGLTVIGVLLHGAALYTHWFPEGAREISFLDVLSLCALVVVCLQLLSLFVRSDVFDAGLVALPIAVVVLLADWLVPAPGSLLADASATTAWHIVSSVMAFGVLSIAAVYAVFVALIDHFLRQHHLNRLVRALPALDVLEGLLFRLIAAGFLLLTISLGTGLLFVDDLFAQHLAHKTLLSIVAWVVFGTLLWGRQFRGWRGRTAVQMTIAGVLLLVLAYFGSKLVLEVLLDRSWQT